jgi:hypothetical protein
LRQAVEQFDHKTASRILNEDKDWLACDNETKKQLLSFQDVHGHPYVYRPICELTAVWHLRQPWREAISTVMVLIQLGFASTIIPANGHKDTLWHYALDFGEQLPRYVIYSLLNVLFYYSHYNEHVSWQGCVDTLSIIDEAVSLHVNDRIIAAFIEHGADVHQIDQPLNALEPPTPKSPTSDVDTSASASDVHCEWRRSLTIGTLLDAQDPHGSSFEFDVSSQANHSDSPSFFIIGKWYAGYISDEAGKTTNEDEFSIRFVGVSIHISFLSSLLSTTRCHN